MPQTPRTTIRILLCVAFVAALPPLASAQSDHDQSSPSDLDFGGSYCDSRACSRECRQSRDCGILYGEFQFLHLSMFQTEDGQFTDDQTASLGSDDGYRLMLGYQTAEGLGLRLRYFDFDGRTSFSDGVGGLSASSLDFEVTDRFCLGKMQGLLSAGYRHGKWKQLYQNDTYTRFSGDGVTLGAILERNLGCNLNLYGWAQQSILFGDDTINNEKNLVIGWTDIQFGVQYKTQINHCNAFIRAGVEAQRHASLAETDSQDTGLVGWFLSAGFHY